MKKFVIATLITTSALSTVGYAAGNMLDPGTSGGMSAGLLTQQDFDNKYTQSANWVTNQTYPSATNQTNPVTPSITNTPYLNNLQLTNGAGLKPSEIPHHLIEQQTNLSTEINIDNSLKQFMFDLNGNHFDTQKTIKAKKIVHENQNQNQNPNPNPNPNQNDHTQPTVTEEAFQHYVSDNAPANLINGKNYTNSGTLYIANPELKTAIQGHQMYMSNKDLFDKPTVNHNDYLNFSTLISPTAYNTEQAEAAKKYIVFAAQSTKNLGADLKLKDLLPTSLSDAQKKNLPNVIYKFKNDERFLNYMMKINTLVAIRSISLNALEYLIAERTPVTGLGKAAGKTTKTASPLEVEAYQANHRITDPNWYKTIMQDSPATVQRSILITLAEIEHQNYQAHLDRERILAALTAANLSSNSSAAMALKEAAMGANDAIKDAVKQYEPNTPTPAAPPPPPVTPPSPLGKQTTG